MYYHLYNRGNNRQAIFFQQDNYLYFLQRVRKYLCPVAKMVAYCLMPTHYHMLVRVESSQTSEVSMPQTSEFSENSEVSQVMMRLSVSYTKAINKRFARVGALFQGRFQARYIKDYGHLLNLCVYIHANPVKDGLVADPADWIYSNYLEWLGQRDGSLVDREFIEEHFGSPAEYQALVMDYLKTRALPDEVKTYLQALEN
jgi:REP element-mobilizing transposase RayT